MKEINLKSSTIEKSLDLAKGFLQSLVKPSIDELGLLIADKVKVWRLKNQINTLGKVQKIVKENNIEPQQVNLKVLLPYLDAVSLEDDEKLQDIWANLLVNYIDSSKNLTSVVYPNILRQLSSKEIKILFYMFNNHGHINISKRKVNLANKENLEVLNKDLNNLERLSVIENIKIFNPENKNLVKKAYLDTWEFGLTSFGFEFIKACQIEEN